MIGKSAKILEFNMDLPSSTRPDQCMGLPFSSSSQRPHDYFQSRQQQKSSPNTKIGMIVSSSYKYFNLQIIKSISFCQRPEDASSTRMVIILAYKYKFTLIIIIKSKIRSFRRA